MAESLAARREYEKQARYDAILDAAETAFSDKGYERTSMDDIARGANLSRALLYVYFKDKAAIQQGIILRAADALQERFKVAKTTATTGLDQLSAIGRAYYQFYRDQPDYFAALTKAATDGQLRGDCHADELVHAEAQIMNTMLEAVQTGLADGTLNRDHIRDSMETVLFLRGALHGVILLCKREDNQPLIEHTLAMLLSSVASVQR